MHLIHFGSLLLVTLASLLAGCATVAQPPAMAFSVAQLAGWWSDSTSTAPACTKDEPRIRF
ncbi:MAG: hypothetical protein Q8M07_07720, partial [Prosthecobacter sp.]|nr:hypothetical protein [Prosthecobacter sp.]